MDGPAVGVTGGGAKGVAGAYTVVSAVSSLR